MDCLTFTAVGSSGRTWLKLGALKKIALCLGKLVSRLLLFCILLPCQVECYIYFYGQCVLQLRLHNTNRCTQYASIQHTHFVITLSLNYHFITNCISGSINVLLIYTNCTHKSQKQMCVCVASVICLCPLSGSGHVTHPRL